ncbi:MAG: DUF481 domain-containing protein [Planctomycetes bacterium]|nr:DUF481 domain-containing protein [Planctomycetota bacterium]
MRKFPFVLLVGVLVAAPALADQVVLQNGDRITGEVVKLDGKTVEMKAEGGAAHTIPRDQIATIATENEMVIGLPDGRLVNGRVESPQPSRVRVVPVTGDPFEIGMSELSAINPVEKEKTEWERWSAKATLAVTIKDGNSHSKTASARGFLSRRGENTRLSFRAGWDYVQTEGVLSERSTFGEGRFDYFITKRLFAYTAHLFEGSYSQRLDLRYTGSLGLGYQFIEEKTMNLSAGAGAAYVKEQYKDSANDDEYVAGTATLHFDWKITDSLLFVEDLTAYSGLERVEDFRGVSETSLTATLTNHLGATAMIVFEYDNTPAAGRKRTDTTYILGLTYTM